MKRTRYFDLQVNGYAGIDFNAKELPIEALSAACDRLVADGVAGILATIITDDVATMCRRLANIRRGCEASPVVRQMICGIHIEGPYINQQPGYVGAHPLSSVRPADIDSMKQLLDAAGGMTRIVTLAPEQDEDARVIEYLSSQGIRVSAGHCNPTAIQLRRAIDSGLSMFTHLGNGCPGMLPRHDNIIQRVLALAEHLDIGFIADGVHVPFIALNNYLKCCGLERAFIVTDAISAAGMGPGTYELAGQQVIVDESLATWSADRTHLMGSAGTMQRSEDNLRRYLNLSDDDINRLLVTNPRRAIGIKV
jgi:N-acetylglucosamine-6-phosphate deacetylase